MEVGDWITLSAVIVALFIGVASIVVTFIIRAKDIAENRRVRSKEKQFIFQIDVLNEVRNWAAEAVKLGFQYNQSTNNADLHQVVILLDDIAKNTDFADLAIRLFPDELKFAILAVMNVLSTNQRQITNHPGDKGIIGDDYYFDRLYELMKSIRDVKLQMYNIGQRGQ